MSRSFSVRKLFALAALMLLLGTAPLLAQNDLGFIEAPTPADLDTPSRPIRLAQAPDDLPPETLDADAAQPIEVVEPDEPDFDYTLDESTTQKPTLQKGGACCDDCGCDDCCQRSGGLFGCLRRMMETCASHKRARCNGCYDKPRLLDHSMTCQKGQRHDANRTPHASQPLFRQYYAQPNAGGNAAQMYVAPYPVPAAVGHTYITYQAFEPSQFMYRHKRHYVRRHGPSGGTTSTRIYWW